MIIYNIMDNHVYYEYYFIKSSNTNNTYFTNVKYYKNKSGICTNIYLIFGGKRIECMNVSINMDEFDDRKWYAYINQVEYFDDCIVRGSLNRKKKDTLDFLHSCCHFIIKKFPFVSEFMLTDTSQVQCYSNKKQLDLKNLDITLHNKTWYERHFNAEIKNRETWLRYIISIKNFNDPEYRMKKFINYNHFKSFFNRYIENEPNLKLEEFFNQTNTIREFLQKVIENIDCENYYKFLGTFFKNLFQIDICLNEWFFVYKPLFEVVIIQIPTTTQNQKKKLNNFNSKMINKLVS